MAFVMLLEYHAQRQFRRESIFRDRSNPLDIYTDEELFSRFRFPRYELLALIDEFAQELEFPTQRKGSLSAGMQIMIALRFLATGSFQEVIGDVFGVSRMTVHRCIVRVSAVLKRAICRYVHFDNDQETDQTKRNCFAVAQFPGVIGCIDCTHIRIQAPSVNEGEFVNRQAYHSINVQLICDADLKILNAVIK